MGRERKAAVGAAPCGIGRRDRIKGGFGRVGQLIGAARRGDAGQGRALETNEASNLAHRSAGVHLPQRAPAQVARILLHRHRVANVESYPQSA